MSGAEKVPLLAEGTKTQRNERMRKTYVGKNHESVKKTGSQAKEKRNNYCSYHDSYGWCIPQRYILGIMSFLGLANGYLQRFCLSLAITEMVAVHSLHPSKIDPYACPLDTSITGNATVHKTSGEFSWDETTQGLILSAFFWGYVVMQIPGGLVAERTNAKVTLQVGLLVSSLATVATPFVARAWGPVGLIVTRFILGIGQGPLYPSLNVLLAKWAPTTEKSRLGALVFAGAQIGNVVSMALSGFLIYSGGWASVFYVYGTSGLVWVILWHFLCFPTPDKNPYISSEEFKYLEKEITETTERQNLGPTPWKRIFTSVPFWGLVVAQIGHDWGLFTIITDLPKYMKSVLHFSVTQNGLWSAAPHLMMWVFAMICGVVMDWLIGKKQCNKNFVKKAFITIAALGPAAGILAATYAGCDKILVAVCFTIGMGLMGAFLPSLKVNPLDLSPNYAGTLMALVGGIGAVSGIITPYLVGLLTPNSTMLEWRLVFWISVIVLTVTNTVYVFTGSAEVQPWNDAQSPSAATTPKV